MPDTTEEFEVFLARLIEHLKRELADDQDEMRSIRRALLGLIIATSDVERRAARRLATFLLQEFPPLAEKFDDDIHMLLDEFDVRRHCGGDDAELLFPTALTSAIMAEEMSPEDLVLAGLRWPWELTAERYVAFFDIMGFKALLDRHQDDHSGVYEIMDALRDAAVSAEGMGYDSNAPHGPLNFPGCWLRFAQFSDSIVLVTRDGSTQSSAIIALATQLMFARALGIGLAIRGAIAKGPFTADFDKSIFFGQPLVDAYLLEEKQAWYGACYHPTADDGGTDPRTGAPLQGSDLVPKGWIPTASWYPVPVKTGEGHEEMSAINWAMLFKGNPAALDEVIEHMRNDDDPKLKAYFDETRRFGHAMLELMENHD